MIGQNRMSYLIWGLLGILAFIKKNNKFVSFLNVLFIFCVFCFNTANPDLDNYMTQYYGLARYYTEPVFVSLEVFFRDMGLNYEIFRCFVVVVSLFLIVSTIYRYSPYPTLVLFLFTIYPMTMDVVQLRFFAGYSFVLFAIRFIVDYQNKRKIKFILLFFLFVFLATGCHYACALYSVLGLLFLKIEKHKFFYLFFIPLCAITFLFMIDRFVPLIAYVVGDHKAYLWANRIRVPTGLNMARILVSRFMPLLFSIFITYIGRNAFFKELQDKDLPSGIRMFFENMSCKIVNDYNQFYNLSINRILFVCIYYVSLFSILELTVALDYERMTRLGLLLTAVLVSRQLYYLTNLNKIIVCGLLLLLFVSYFASIMFFTKDFNNVFRMVMENNNLF